MRLDDKGYTPNWPRIGSVIVNGSSCLEMRIPENPNAKKRKDEPMNITTLLNIG